MWQVPFAMGLAKESACRGSRNLTFLPLAIARHTKRALFCCVFQFCPKDPGSAPEQAISTSPQNLKHLKISHDNPIRFSVYRKTSKTTMVGLWSRNPQNSKKSSENSRNSKNKKQLSKFMNIPPQNPQNNHL